MTEMRANNDCRLRGGGDAKANSCHMSFMSVRANAAMYRPLITINQEMFS